MTVRWNFVLTLLLSGFALLSDVIAEDLGKLTFCDDRHDPPKAKRLVLVSTLDGKLSALDVEDGGSEAWSLLTGPGPMLSSSIHRLELTNNGQWVRMIPSLSGGLYKFNGEDIEPIPVTAENLLKSSFRYSDDLVISGGKESRTYGIDVDTGRVLYECSMNKCDNLTGFEEAVGDVILVQRQTQTVRAVEPRSGVERWNFSVGQHDIKVVPNPSTGCHDKHDSSINDIVLKVIVPDGLVCATSKSKPGIVIWKHKFEFPVVSAWEVVGEKVEWVDLFGGASNLRLSEDVPDSPLLYIGMHNKQLYIQESVTLQNKILESIHKHPYNLIADESGYVATIPWKPVPASGRTLEITGQSEPVLQITDETNQVSTTALSVLYGSEYVNGNGFFLYSSESLIKKDTALCSPGDMNHTIATEREGSGNDDEVYIYAEEVSYPIISVWHWWREIVFLSIGCAIAINIVIQRRFIPEMLRLNSEVIVIANADTAEAELQGPWKLQTSLSETYTSRYLTDFEPVHCLGKGGFGVVFQAKNKIDDCHYAIKRITLPNKERARKRVMREVKALAKLDHQNIVRYFNAWVEYPPADWQDEQDRHWAQMFSGDLKSDGAITVDLSGHVTPTSELPPTMNDAKNRKRKNNFLKSLWDKASSLYSGGEITDSFARRPIDATEKSDSFIVFDSSKPAQTSWASDSFIVKNSDSSEGACGGAGDEGSSSDSCRPPPFVARPDSLALGDNNNATASTSGIATATLPTRIYLYIQMQLCQKDSLREWLTTNMMVRDPKQVVNIFSQIVRAVEYVHFQGLIHRDLKPSNIFFSPDGQIKVGDFGLVTGMVEGGNEFGSPLMYKSTNDLGERHTARVGTQLYMSPEQLLGQQYNYKVDIYSLGLILFELLVPFTTQMERHRTLSDVRSGVFPKNFKDMYPDEYELLRLMLCESPEKRLTTIGIRCRKPLVDSGGVAGAGGNGNGGVTPPPSPLEDAWHFELPLPRRRNSSSKSSSQES